MILHALIVTRLLALPEETRQEKKKSEIMFGVEEEHKQHVASICLLLQKANSPLS